MTRCYVCGKSVFDGVTLYRQNPKGEDSIMACIEHNQKPIDPIIDEITSIIEADGKTKQ